MQKSLKEYIAFSLKRLKPLKPQRTVVEKKIIKLDNIKAVLFDIYGTLLISASGDVESLEFSLDSVMVLLNESAVKINKDDKLIVEEIFNNYKSVIQDFHNKSMGIKHPEVDIVKVWEKVIINMENRGIINIQSKIDYKKLAFAFESTHNPVYPMPDMKIVLKKILKKDFQLGIISNAQFITPIILNFFLTGSADITETVKYFNPFLSFYSYKYLQAKPGLFLFNKAKKKLLSFEISPEEVVYIGNDMQNDIWAAKQVGFKTVLFAGDKRSLRLRRDNPEAAGIVPDAVITELKDLLDIL